jgi:hypothetical protein
MVKETKPVVIWNTRAAKYFREAYERIKEDSPANAEKVRDVITKMIDGFAGSSGEIPTRQV